MARGVSTFACPSMSPEISRANLVIGRTALGFEV